MLKLLVLKFSKINEMLKNVKRKWVKNLHGIGHMVYLYTKLSKRTKQ